MRVWCLTTSPANFSKSAELGWQLQGVKARRRKTAEQLRPGDKLVYYVTEHAAFGAVVEVRSECFEDHDPIWVSTPGEDYPWRVEIAPEVVVEGPAGWAPAETVYDELEFVKKWPREHWNRVLT